MSDVHSVGGYITAGSLFALGLSSWQVLVALLVGILIVQYFCNLVAKPSQVTGTPYPGHLPLLVRRARRQHPGHHPRADRRGLVWHPDVPGVGRAHDPGALLLSEPGAVCRRAQHGFVGLSTLGWFAFMFMWVLQALVFWHGMEAIKHFIDWAGPGVYVVMVLWRLPGVEGRRATST